VTGGTAEKITVNGLAAGVKVKTTVSETADNLVLGLTDAAGTADTISLEITANGVASDVLNLDAAGIEVLNVNQKSANVSNLDLAGVTATTGSKTTVNFTGVGDVVAKSMGSTIDTVIATGTGALTVAAADRANTAMTITGGQGADSIALEHTSDVLDGGAGTNDTLVVSLSAILGGISVDLGATDQIVSLNGGANSAAQSNFENVNLNAFTGFGAVVAGSTGANNIVGTALADQITGGNGADTITGGGGNDAIVLTETVSSQDTVVVEATAAANGVDTITGFATTVDKFNVDALGTATSLSGTGAAVAYTHAVNTVAFFTGLAAGSADVSNAALITALNAAVQKTAGAGGTVSYIIVVDDNSSALYEVTDDGVADEYTGDTIVLMGTIDAVLVAGDIVFA